MILEYMHYSVQVGVKSTTATHYLSSCRVRMLLSARDSVTNRR